jgi:hypothetical protein
MRYPLQSHYTKFENNLCRVLPLLSSDQQAFVSQGTDFVLASMIARTGKMWYIDAQLRILLATLRILLGLEQGVVFPYPGVMDAGKTIIDGFEFDDGEEEVEIDC